MDLPDLGIKSGPPALQVGSLPTELPGKPRITIWEKNKYIKSSAEISLCALGLEDGRHM